MNEIIFVTGNKGKQESAQHQFDKEKVKITCFDSPNDEPMVNDIEYIAKCKVLQAYKLIGKPCIALDAGFYIDNYPNNPGFPGAFPKRELLDKIGIDGVLDAMKNIGERSCYFMECLAYYDGADLKVFFGTSVGTISYEKHGTDSLKKWSDLWYIFIPQNCKKTLAEMTDDERNNRPDDHTNALEKFKEWFVQEKNSKCR